MVTEDGKQLNQVHLSNGETVKTRLLVGGASHHELTNPKVVSKLIGVVSSPLTSLFESSIEGSPLAAVAVVVINSFGIVEHRSQPYPIYIMAHSSETGECPANQCQYLPSPFDFSIALHDDPTYEYLSTLSEFH
jgi:hypothetical protein